MGKKLPIRIKMDEIIEITRANDEVCIKIRTSPEEIANAVETPYITASDVAAETGLTRMQINNLAPRIPGAYQTKTTKYWLYPYSAIRFLQSYARVKTGRPKKKSK